MTIRSCVPERILRVAGAKPPGDSSFLLQIFDLLNQSVDFR